MPSKQPATEPSESSAPPAINELWMLWSDVNKAWVVSLDDAPGGESFLCCLTESEAQMAADYQNGNYELSCRAVRIK